MGSMRRAGHRASAPLWALAALSSMLALGVPRVASGATVSPLPESDYAVRSVCSAPARGHAGCLSLRLVPQTAAARAHTHPVASTRSLRVAQTHALSAAEGGYGLRPQDLRSAYFPGKTELPEAPASEPQTIALVDAYNDPNAETDLQAYDKEFKLPLCTTANGCFAKVNQRGEAGNYPTTRSTEREAASGWALETATDIEVAHAVCQQNCKIVLVEANTPSYGNLEAAEETAVRLGATEMSNSWGGEEPATDSAAFNHPSTAGHSGVVITAASGDQGYLNWTEAAEAEKRGEPHYAGADYPASSPDVVGVGGTKLTLSGGAWQSETAWNDPLGAGGSACSTHFNAPSWQPHVSDWATVGCGQRRAVADVAADADPYTGVAVYDSVPYEEGGHATVLGWTTIGGTSVASPIVASMFALAGGAHQLSAGSHEGEYATEILYSHLGSPLLHDVTAGGNGKCNGVYTSCSGSMEPLSAAFPLDCGQGVWICNAAAGYDGPTGVGTPNGIGAFKLGEAPTGEVPVKSGGSSGSGSTVGGSEGSSGSGSKEGGGTGGGGTGGQPTGGSSSGSASGESSGTPSGPAGTSSSSSGNAANQPPRISALTLTANARTALRHGSLGVAQLAFSFRLSRAATVRVTLAARVGSGAHRRWRALPVSLKFAATRGSNRRHLHGAGVLGPGIYRLTLTPAHGAARSISIRVR